MKYIFNTENAAHLYNLIIINIQCSINNLSYQLFSSINHMKGYVFGFFSSCK